MFLPTSSSTAILLLSAISGTTSSNTLHKGDAIPEYRDHWSHSKKKRKFTEAEPKVQTTVQRKALTPPPQAQSAEPAGVDTEDPPTLPSSGLSAALQGVNSQVSALEALESQVLNSKVQLLEVLKATYERELKEQEDTNQAVVRENDGIQSDIDGLKKSNAVLKKQAGELQESNSLTRDQLLAAESNSGLSQKLAASSLESMDDSQEKVLAILGKDSISAPTAAKDAAPDSTSEAVPAPVQKAIDPAKISSNKRRHKLAVLAEVASSDEESATDCDSDGDANADAESADDVESQSDDVPVATDSDDAGTAEATDGNEDDDSEEAVSFLAMSSKSRRETSAVTVDTAADTEGANAQQALAEMQALSALDSPAVVSAPNATVTEPRAASAPPPPPKAAQEPAKPAEMPMAMTVVSSSASSEKEMIATLQQRLSELNAQKRLSESSLSSLLSGATKAGAARHNALLAEQAKLKAARRLLTNTKAELTAAVTHLESTRKQLQQRLQSLGDMAKKLMNILVAPAAQAPTLLKLMPSTPANSA